MFHRIVDTLWNHWLSYGAPEAGPVDEGGAYCGSLLKTLQTMFLGAKGRAIDEHVQLLQIITIVIYKSQSLYLPPHCLAKMKMAATMESTWELVSNRRNDASFEVSDDGGRI